MKRYCPEGYYVYLHIRVSDGLVFYVGKGHKFRAWEFSWKSRKNTHWQRTKEKHGIRVEVYKERMSSDCALTLEKILIAKYISLGHPLTNKTSGGDGFVGVNNDERIEKLVEAMAKPVVSSLGEYFVSVSDATRWLTENGHPSASATAISMCCRNIRSFAYGRAWSFGSIAPDHPIITDAVKFASQIISKAVVRSDGEVFISAHEAARIMRQTTHPKASSSSIRKACLIKPKTAYGYTWEYLDV